MNQYTVTLERDQILTVARALIPCKLPNGKWPLTVWAIWYKLNGMPADCGPNDSGIFAFSETEMRVIAEALPFDPETAPIFLRIQAAYRDFRAEHGTTPVILFYDTLDGEWSVRANGQDLSDLAACDRSGAVADTYQVDLTTLNHVGEIAYSLNQIDGELDRLWHSLGGQ